MLHAALLLYCTDQGTAAALRFAHTLSHARLAEALAMSDLLVWVDADAEARPV